MATPVNGNPEVDKKINDLLKQLTKITDNDLKNCSKPLVRKFRKTLGHLWIDSNEHESIKQDQSVGGLKGAAKKK